jgi:hypothetical protein
LDTARSSRNGEFLKIFRLEIKKVKKPNQPYVTVGRRLLYWVFTTMMNHKPCR